MVTLSEALQILESGDWCALRFITADVNKGSGGKVIELAKCRIARRNDNTVTAPKTGKAKSASHRFHFTRNVELQNKQLRKVHPILITHINHRPVV